MRMVLLPLLLAPVVLAQQPRPQAFPPRDGGVALDAGLSLRPGSVDAGLPPASLPAGGEVERLKREVAELRARLGDLEQKQARASALADDLERLSKQVDTLKGQVTQLKDAEDKRASAESSAAEQRAATAAASTNLNAVLAQLSTGNTRGIEPSLQYAEATFTGNAQRLVQLARQALAQGDLANARSYLVLAITEANSPQR